MVGAVHPVQTVELLVELERANYTGTIYFDTFPDHSGLDPVEEARTNIQVVTRLQRIATDLVSDTDFDLGNLADDPASELVSEVATADDDFDFRDESDSANTKLDLARAYIDMGDEDGARDILKEVLDEGSAEQQEQAQSLLEGL